MLKTLRNEAVNRQLIREPGSVVSTGCVLVPTPPNFKDLFIFLLGTTHLKLRLPLGRRIEQYPIGL
jgi:hypothetical protein